MARELWPQPIYPSQGNLVLYDVGKGDTYKTSYQVQASYRTYLTLPYRD